MENSPRHSVADCALAEHSAAGLDHAPVRIEVRRDIALLVAVVGLAVVSVGGAFVSVADGLDDSLVDAMGPSGRLSIPIPMMIGQLVAAWLASGRRRGPALVAGGLLAVVAPVCIVSGFFDGGYSDPSRTGGHAAYQGLLVVMIATVGVLAGRRVVHLARGRRGRATQP